MATRIERLEASLKKERERRDIKSLRVVENHIAAARVILDSHPFRFHRSEVVKRLNTLLADDVHKCITEVLSTRPDDSTDKAVM